MARREPARNAPAAATLDFTLNVDLTVPEIRNAVRQGMLDSLRTVEDAVLQTLGSTFRGHFPRNRGIPPAASALRSKLFDGPRGFLGVTGWGPKYFYLHIQEHGAKPHVIRARGFTGTGRRRRRIEPKQLVIPVGGASPVYRSMVRHPGLRPRRFLLQAATLAEPRILSIMKTRIAEVIGASNVA